MPPSAKWPHIHNEDDWRFADIYVYDKDDEKYVEVIAEGISLHDLFKILHNKRTCILLEGAPGIGKSTLSFQIWKTWASDREKSDFFSQYQLAIPLWLNNSNIQNIQSPWELFPSDDRDISKSVYEKVKERRGQGVLFILDGFDELPLQQTKEDSIFFKLISGSLPSLSRADIIVSTRHSPAFFPNKVSFSQKFEIIGFTEAGIKSYIESMACKESTVLDTYLQIKGCLHVPLNLVCLIEIVKDNQRLPETLTKLYASLVSALIARYIQQSKYKDQIQVNPDAFYKLPQEIYLKFLKVCEIAYRKLTKSDDDMDGVRLDSDDSLGLLTLEPEGTCYGIRLSYSFAHSSIQEFLAAYYISRKAHDEIVEHFEKMANNSYLQVLLFLSSFSPPTTASLEKYFNFIADIDTENSIVYFHWLSFFQVLFEAKMEPNITHFLVHFKKVVVRRTASLLSPYIFYILGRCIRFSKSIWEVHFTCRSLELQHIDMFRQGLASHDTNDGHITELLWGYNSIGSQALNVLQLFPESEVKCLQKLDIRGTRLDSSACRVLAESLHMFQKLEILLMNDNDICYGEHAPLIAAINRVEPKPLRNVSFSKLTSNECIDLLLRDKLEFIKLWLLSANDLSCLLSNIHSIQRSSVTTLKIRASEIDDTRIFSLCHHLPSLRTLKFVNCNIKLKNAVIAPNYKVSLAPQLCKIDLSRSILDSSACEILATYLHKFIGLEILLLRETHAPCQYTSLIQAINDVDSKPIRKVSFANLTAEQCSSLLSCTKLEKIKLWDISGEVIKNTISKMPFNDSLTILKICESEITAAGIMDLPTALQCLPSLRTIRFIGCGINCEAVKIIAEALDVCRNITTLDLRYNNIREVGGAWLGWLLLQRKNDKRLERWLIHYNPLGKQKITDLFKLRHKCIK